MNSEARIVRPFVSFGDADALFRHARLAFGNQICEADSQIIFDGDPTEFLASGCAIEWSDSLEETETAIEEVQSALRDVGVELGEASLVILASSRYLQIADIVVAVPVSDLSGAQHHVVEVAGQRARALRAVHHGFTISAYIALNADRESEPLRPHRRGTWLSATDFRVALESTSNLFQPRPLTDEVRRVLDLGSNVTRYIEWEDHNVVHDAEQQALPVLYVDQRILGQLDAHARTSASKAFQHQLVVDFIEAVIFEAARTPDLENMTYEDVRDSLVGRIIKMAAPKSSSYRQDLLDRIASDPRWVVAQVENVVNLRRPILALLEGEST